MRRPRVTHIERTGLQITAKVALLAHFAHSFVPHHHVLYTTSPRQHPSCQVFRGRHRPEGRCRHERPSSERSQSAATLQASDPNWCARVQTVDGSECLTDRTRSGEVLLGTALSIASIEMAGICAQLNFDWCFIDAEHTPMRSVVFMLGGPYQRF
jgi:hypothetical protein